MLSIISILLLALIFFLWYFPSGPYTTAYFSQVDISFGQMLGMRMRGTDCQAMVNAYITLQKADIEGSLIELEAAYLAGGDLHNITMGLMKAKKTGLEMSLNQALEADLKGMDMVAAKADTNKA